MPSSTCWRRSVALPVIAALSTSGFLLGAPQAQAATSAPQTSQGSPAIAVQASAGSPDARLGPAERRKKKIRKAVAIGLNQVGDPYSYGATGPSAFDCSGLTSYAFQRAGLSLPRTSGAQASKVRTLKRKQNVKRGDLVFFHSGGSVYHVAVYLGRKNGNRVILHAPSTGSNVERSTIWTNSWYAGTLRPRRG